MSILNWFAEVQWSLFHIKQWRAFIMHYKKIASLYEKEKIEEEYRWAWRWSINTLNRKGADQEIALWTASLSWMEAKMSWISNDMNSARKSILVAIEKSDGAPRHLSRWLIPHLHAWLAIIELCDESKKNKKAAVFAAHNAVLSEKEYRSAYFNNDRILLCTTILRVMKYPEIDRQYWEWIRDDRSLNTSQVNAGLTSVG
jgi:hypothetical protein